MRKLENGVYDIPLIVSPSLHEMKTDLKLSLINAQKRIVEFASRYGWDEYIEESFMDNATIFDNQEDMKKRLFEIYQIDEIPLPDTFSACLEERHLLAISPSLYEKIYPIDTDPIKYEKLMAHEIAHRLHVRILQGDEEKMGPPWFYEGFALFAAEQFLDFTISEEEIKQIILNDEEKSYPYYAATFRYLVHNFNILEFIHHPESIKEKI